MTVKQQLEQLQDSYLPYDFWQRFETINPRYPLVTSNEQAKKFDYIKDKKDERALIDYLTIGEIVRLFVVLGYEIDEAEDFIIHITKERIEEEKEKIKKNTKFG